MNEPNPLLDTLRSHVRDLEVRIAEAERDTQNRGNVLAAAIAAADKARWMELAACRGRTRLFYTFGDGAQARCGKTEPDANELAYHMKYECRG